MHTMIVHIMDLVLALLQYQMHENEELYRISNVLILNDNHDLLVHIHIQTPFAVLV